MEQPFIHHTALVESDQIGQGTRIWAFVHIMPDVVVGNACNICDHAFIESGVRIGNGVTVKNQVMIWKGVEVADYVFLGPNVVFTNDLHPRSPRQPQAAKRYGHESGWLRPTRVEEGATIGANATILCGLSIGTFSMVGAGSVVTRDVAPFQLVAGNPARPKGYVDRSGCVLKEEGDLLVNPETGEVFRMVNHQLEASSE